MRPDFTAYFNAVCPTPTKRRYLTGEEADAALTQTKEYGGTAVCRTYQCTCGWFHLTSHEPWSCTNTWRQP